MKRQKIRRLLLILSFMLFPITIWYFSPYLIIQAAMHHILNGSFIVFMIMLFASTFAGRVFCGYLCPAGGIQECVSLVNDRRATGGLKNNIKYVIWIIWILAVIATHILGKNQYTIDFFYMTERGISISEIYDFIIYYGVLFVIIIPALLGGKRGSCHYICWMAPFMVIGSSIGRFLHIPQLHIEAEKDKCVSCKSCEKACPMGLKVCEMVTGENKAELRECIQCGACVDTCPKKALRYKMFWR